MLNTKGRFHNQIKLPVAMTTKGIKSLSITLLYAVLDQMEKDGMLQEIPTVEVALKQFSYFDTWNKKTISDCCLLGKIKVFSPDDVILGSEDGEFSGVHFIVEGTCKLIEHLYLMPNEKFNTRAKSHIFRDKKIVAHANVPEDPKYSSLLFNMDNVSMGNISVENTDQSKSDILKFERKQNENRELTEKEMVDLAADAGSDGDNDIDENVGEQDVGISKVEIELPNTKNDGKFSKFYSRLLPYKSSKNKNVTHDSKNIESHFLQIAMIYKGCCLGLGERHHNRFLVSVTRVICMVIPLQFLLQHNPNNIWNRIKQFLNHYLPTHDKILSEYFINNKWSEDKRIFILSKNVASATKLCDVPKSIRLNDSNKRLREYDHNS